MLKLMIDMNHQKYRQAGWEPPILRTEAIDDRGIAEVIEQLENHRANLKQSSGALPSRRAKEQVEKELAEMIKNRLFQGVLEQLKHNSQFEAAVTAIVNKETDPYSACDRLIPTEFKSYKK